VSAPASWIGLPSRLGLETEQWEQHAWQLLCDLRVACPGIVKGWDLTTYPQTVQVQLAIRENVNENLVTTPTEIPILTVPFQVVRSGGYLLTMPIAVGDECLVIFTDNNARAWWQNGGVQNQITRRRHSINDGFAILGIYSQPRNITNYSTTTAQLRTEDGESYIELTAGHAVNIVAPAGCNITGNVSVSGTVTAAGEVTGSSIELSQHKHLNVQPGSGESGLPTG
jgi:hypothetical protein